MPLSVAAGLQVEIYWWLLFADPSQEGSLVAKADAAVSLNSAKISEIDCTNGKCASAEEAKVCLNQNHQTPTMAFHTVPQLTVTCVTPMR